MPGTPPTTTPDLLPRIGDTDSPDIPRDMNALADATQAALTAHRGEVAPHPAMPMITNAGAVWKFIWFNITVTTDATGESLGNDLSDGGKYSQIGWMCPVPYGTSTHYQVTVTDATANSVNFHLATATGANAANVTVNMSVLCVAG